MAPEASEGLFARNADALRRRARFAERKGLEHLDRGMLVSAIDALREALESYRSLGDATQSDSVEQYMALAMYEEGDTEEAVSLWEQLIARGWDRPTTLNFLVRHYESRGDDASTQRLYAQLERSKQQGSGFFSEFVGEEPLPDVAADAGPTLLVADNDPVVRGVLGRILEAQGYNLLYAEDGEGALAVVFDAAPDLIFLDIYMPRLSGLDVLYRMRAEGVGTPVVVLSGRRHATMVQDSRALGAHFATRPLDFEQISEMVREILGSERNA
jgi:CheY-like chemotaxis protein